MKNKIFHTQDPCLHTNSRCAKNSSRMEIIMELLEIAKKRHSVRKYTGKEIEQEKLDKILEAAHVAPTAANMQPVRLIVVKSKEGLEKVGKAANIYQARLPLSSVPIRQKPGSVRLTARSQPTSMPRS